MSAYGGGSGRTWLDLTPPWLRVYIRRAAPGFILILHRLVDVASSTRTVTDIVARVQLSVRVGLFRRLFVPYPSKCLTRYCYAVANFFDIRRIIRELCWKRDIVNVSD